MDVTSCGNGPYLKPIRSCSTTNNARVATIWASVDAPFMRRNTRRWNAAPMTAQADRPRITANPAGTWWRCRASKNT